MGRELAGLHTFPNWIFLLQTCNYFEQSIITTSLVVINMHILAIMQNINKLDNRKLDEQTNANIVTITNLKEKTELGRLETA